MDFNQPSQSHPYEPLGESLVWAHGYEDSLAEKTP